MSLEKYEVLPVEAQDLQIVQYGNWKVRFPAGWLI